MISDTMYRTQYISDYRKWEDGNYFAYNMTMEKWQKSDDR